MEAEIRGYKGIIKHLEKRDDEHIIQLEIWNGTITLYHVKAEEIKILVNNKEEK